jgi:hypothetical protein
MVNWESPLQIDLLLDPSYDTVSADITVTGEISSTNNKVLFILTNLTFAPGISPKNL